ncbi:(2,3-dihydroxybenzoyl)adenylate synthase [Paracidovorax wautersii]|jgi:2,3-dihydroxybenzoate-AMP ligase|uniref:2,3-dihydroxybenzoate-AMP ligase n=1 Tax=Paracidovorax wautersii TaxID=1177982 RepID=A0A1I2E0J5_9BURK|nr:AMP-binding protein [Paracidovorax wautersii]GAO20736.1 AMP-dependent synthetase and ligase [Alicycliphilus sp. B1]SFE85770.1 2,3-dihydroxybenzoate-AMP ligase [Paracidovorax wautersii]
MLVGCVPWPTKDLLRWNASGYREGRPIVEIVRAAAAQYPDKPAVIENDSVLSYAQLLSKAEALAAALLGAGLRPLDRVVMQLPNSAEFVIAFLALSRIGAIPVMALRAHRHSEIRHFIDASGAVAYMVPGVHGNYDYRALAQDMQRECPTLRCAFVLDGALAGQHSLRDLLEKPMDEAARQALDAVWVNAAEVAVMLLSGGTTSISKLIPRTHDDYVLNARLCARAAGFDENTVFLALLPLGHNYNLAAPGMLGVFYYGGTVVIGHGTQAEQVFPLVEKHGVTVIAAAVPLITGWLNSDVPSRHDLRSLRVVQNGGARLAPELRRRIHGQWGAIPQEIYGTAEGLINMTRLDDPEDLLLESSGAPVCDDDEIKVVDDDGREVPDGEPGELLTRGPYTIAGYYNAPEKNREAFTEDGFYRMGDIVRKKGRYVFAEGRKKDLINRGGEKISCEEIENLIHKHPKVKEVALVAMPDPVFGEKACAFVVTNGGQPLGFDELIGFLKAQQIASFKLPERLEVVDRLPTSLVGKILKRQLREVITEKLNSEATASR